MLISIPDAINLIFQNLPSLSSEEINIEYALGRVLSEDIVSNIDMPPFDKSAVDGYAVKIKDTPGELPLVQTIQAGDIPKKPLGDGEAVFVMTGAPIPEGTEAVVMREHTKEAPNKVEILSKPKPGANIAYKGEDIKKGEVVIKKGRKISIATVSLLATLGVRRVMVSELPNVAMMVTGSELVEPGEKPIKGGYIYNANGYSLQAACKDIGIEPHYLGIVKDDLESIVNALKSVEKSDIVLISGGVSMGEYDYVKEAVIKSGGEVVFHKVAIKPGKPFLFAKKGKQLIFGMPGNPVSVMVGFWKFIRPAIYKMQGAEEVFPLRIPAYFKGTYKKKSDRPHYISVKLSKEGEKFFAAYIKSNGSADVPAFEKGDGMIEVPKDTTLLEDGERVEVMLLKLPWEKNER